MKKKLKYKIVLFCNKKRIKTLYTCIKKTTLYEHWYEYKTQVRPPFTREIGKRKVELRYELALIFPNNRWAKSVYVRDSLGRNVEAKIENDVYRIKEIIPYWQEELIFDYEKKKHIRYHEMMEYITSIKDIAQIFTLNNKVFVQIENEIRLFGNRNIYDADRLFEIIKNDLINKKRSNFIFVKDVTRHQRKLLYKLLTDKGYKKEELFRHYSY